MDLLLKKVNLDLQFTIYKVLATSSDSGLLEFVPNSQVVLCLVMSCFPFFVEPSAVADR